MKFFFICLMAIVIANCQEVPSLDLLPPPLPETVIPQPQPPPSLECPSGTFGQYPNCQLPASNPPPTECPSGTYGQYPNCQVLTAPPPSPPYQEPVSQYIPPEPQISQCPSGTSGQYPNCQVPTPSPQCPLGTYGQYPNCQAPPSPSPQCPSGATGQYPDCEQPQQNYLPPSNPSPAADFSEQDGYSYHVPSQPFN